MRWAPALAPPKLPATLAAWGRTLDCRPSLLSYRVGPRRSPQVRPVPASSCLHLSTAERSGIGTAIRRGSLGDPRPTPRLIILTNKHDLCRASSALFYCGVSHRRCAP